MSMVQRLELNWIGKHDPKNKISPEPRILVENPEYSYSNSEAIVNEQLSFEEKIKNKVYFDNMLIHGDNLLALKSLELEYAGKIKCIYIDPPYNTGSAFEHYDDNLEHSTWLNLMKPRLELLKTLLSEDGSIWISIDDDEQAYLKVLCDEVFGRSNFISHVIWEKKYAPQNDAKWLSDNHDFIIVYAKNKEKWRPNLLPRTEEMNSRYKNPDNDPRGVWQSDNLTVRTYSAKCDFPITTPSGRIVNPPPSRCWRTSPEKFQELLKDNRIWFGSDGNGVPRIKRFLHEVKQGMTPLTIWKYTEVGHTQDAKHEVTTFNRENPFSTPKPEKLIERILTLATNPGDLILDSFLGSGTTAAVAHKMGRRWIGIELGNHAYTHCYKRLKAVVDGEQGGISKDLNWKGGGGFKFYELAPSLIEKDKFGNPVISDKYTGEMLAEAIAKHKGYYYQPNTEFFWKQSKNGDKNFLYVTENHITPQDLDYIHTLMKQDEHLLICAPSYENECSNQFPNITIQQIPKVLFGKCDFMKEGYSLNVNQNENSEEDNCNE